MPGRPTGLLLTVKQTVPPVRAGAVRREALLARLREADTRLITVVAPAGWGKTSLLSEWAGDPGGRRLAWVSLDQADDEPVRFWTYVLSALHGAGGGISDRPLDALGGADPLDLALPLLLNELAAASTPPVLVLDDYHVLTDPRIHEAVEFLVSYLPPAARLVVAGRADPPLPLARLRARGQLTEIRAADLRFSREEAGTLVTTVSGAALDGPAVTAVWERTEGWAAGLQLAGLALRTAPHFSGRDRHLMDYFATEVVPSLTPAQRDLLVRAAQLERLSGDLCDAALDTTGSAEILAELDRADLFVTALDAERTWYRCHRLLRDALGSSAGSREVLVRAAGWFAAHDQREEAAEHLLRAGDWAAAAEFLEAARDWFYVRGSAARYVALSERLPESALRPQLAMSLAYAAALSGRREQVAGWLDISESLMTPDTVITGWRSAEGALALNRAILATPDSETGLAVQLATRAVDLEARAGGSQPAARMGLGICLFRHGSFAEAAELLADSWRHRDRYGWSPPAALHIGGQLGLSLVGLDRQQDAQRLLREARPLVEQTEREWGPAAGPVVCLHHLTEGRLHYRQGDASAARACLARAVELAEHSSRRMFRVLALVWLGDAELAGGDRPAARTALSRAREAADEEPGPPWVTAELERAETRLGRGSTRAAVRSGVLVEELTDRELSILRMLPGPASQREIGAALFLSVNTVKAYNKSVYRKLAVSSRTEAVAAARGLGLI
jgi:LuxR family maltose regulon positive regulatory protein